MNDSFEAVLAALRRGELVMDRDFDEVFPFWSRKASSVHWTPVEVAVRAAMLLTGPAASPASVTRILDVGAGIGKFCILAAAILPSARVRGIEQRAHLVDIARTAAGKLGLCVEFVQGTLAEEDPSSV